MTESERIKYIFANLDLWKTLHYSNDKSLNEEHERIVKDIKIKILKYGYEETCKMLMI